jgi:hypothetical protein
VGTAAGAPAGGCLVHQQAQPVLRVWPVSHVRPCSKMSGRAGMVIGKMCRKNRQCAGDSERVVEQHCEGD